MANKKKNSLALFEAISQSKAKRSNPNLNIPNWAAASEPPPTAAPTATPAVPAAPETPAAPAPAAPPVVPPAAPAMTAPPPEKRVAFPTAAEPVVSTVGNRLKLNLSYRVSVAVAAGLVLVVVGAIALGKYWKQRPGEAVPAAVGDAGGETKKDLPVLGNEKKDAPPVVVKPERLKGKYYLVIQAFTSNTPKDMQEARRIVEFCGETGEPADVAIFNNRRTGKPFVAVWSLTPYDTNDASDTEKARKQAEVVESAGRKYFAKHQTYKFQQMRDAKGRIVPWLVKYE